MLLFVRLVQTRVNVCGLFQIDFTQFNAQLSNARVQIRAIQILQGRPIYGGLDMHISRNYDNYSFNYG